MTDPVYSSRLTSLGTYRPASKWLHWIVGILVLGMLPVGIIMARMAEGPAQDRLFALHESFGILVLALMILRLANRLRGAPRPAPTLTPPERIASTSVHHLFYVMLFLMPIVGWLGVSAYAGAGPSFFGLFDLPGLLAKNEAWSDRFFYLHWLGGIVLIVLIVLHLGGAAMHAFVKRDGVVWRMLPASWRRV